MGIYKKSYNYYIDYYDNFNRRRREKIGPSITLARTVLKKRLVERAEGKLLDKKEVPRVEFEKAADRYLEYSRTNKRAPSRDITSINHFLPEFEGKYLSEITPWLIEKYKKKRKEEVKGATVNRELACLKNMFTKAIEWGWAASNPVKAVKLFKENNQRLRYLTRQEADLLIECCAPHLKPIVITALNTGMRRGEILSLIWDHVDFENGIIMVVNTKNGERRDIPMNKWLTETLKDVKRQSSSNYMFCNEKGERFGVVRTSFESAVKRAGITDFRFHDLRHTFVSWLVMSGVDLTTVKELLGHKSLDMTLRYAHLSPHHKREAVKNLDTYMDTSQEIKKLTVI